MLNLYRNTIARLTIHTFIHKQKIRLRITIPKLPWNKRIHQPWIFYTIITNKIQARINKICCQCNIFLTRKYFFEACVIVYIYILVLMSPYNRINIQPLLLRIPK